mgnify:CR=1 FL=1
MSCLYLISSKYDVCLVIHVPNFVTKYVRTFNPCVKLFLSRNPLKVYKTVGKTVGNNIRATIGKTVGENSGNTIRKTVGENGGKNIRKTVGETIKSVRKTVRQLEW